MRRCGQVCCDDTSVTQAEGGRGGSQPYPHQGARPATTFPPTELWPPPAATWKPATVATAVSPDSLTHPSTQELTPSPVLHFPPVSVGPIP